MKEKRTRRRVSVNVYTETVYADSEKHRYIMVPPVGTKTMEDGFVIYATEKQAKHVLRALNREGRK